MASPLIFIDGDQGTTGLQIHQRLRDRTDLRLITLSPEHRKDPQRRAEIINACDIAILCLPDQAARDAVASIENPAVRVIDASSAHRTHPDWTYGFAEMNSQQAQRIATARRVSNPGCYPTGAIGLLRPLLEAGLLPRDYPRGRLRKRKIKHAKKVTRFSTAFADPSTADKRRERPKSNCFSVSPENV